MRHLLVNIGSQAASAVVVTSSASVPLADSVPESDGFALRDQLMSCASVGAGPAALDALPEGKRCRKQRHGPKCQAACTPSATISLVVSTAHIPAILHVCALVYGQKEDPDAPI